MINFQQVYERLRDVEREFVNRDELIDLLGLSKSHILEFCNGIGFPKPHHCIQRKHYYIFDEVKLYTRQRAQKPHDSIRLTNYRRLCFYNTHLKEKSGYLGANSILLWTYGTEKSTLLELAIRAYDLMILYFGVNRQRLDGLIAKWREEKTPERRIWERLIWYGKQYPSIKKRRMANYKKVFDWEDTETLHVLCNLYDIHENEKRLGRKGDYHANP